MEVIDNCVAIAALSNIYILVLIKQYINCLVSFLWECRPYHAIFLFFFTFVEVDVKIYQPQEIFTEFTGRGEYQISGVDKSLYWLKSISETEPTLYFFHIIIASFNFSVIFKSI